MYISTLYYVGFPEHVQSAAGNSLLNVDCIAVVFRHSLHDYDD